MKKLQIVALVFLCIGCARPVKYADVTIYTESGLAFKTYHVLQTKIETFGFGKCVSIETDMEIVSYCGNFSVSVPL